MLHKSRMLCVELTLKSSTNTSWHQINCDLKRPEHLLWSTVYHGLSNQRLKSSGSDLECWIIEEENLDGAVADTPRVRIDAGGEAAALLSILSAVWGGHSLVHQDSFAGSVFPLSNLSLLPALRFYPFLSPERYAPDNTQQDRIPRPRENKDTHTRIDGRAHTYAHTHTHTHTHFHSWPINQAAMREINRKNGGQGVELHPDK